ncbi:sensor histidine kinase [Paenibacillus turpanensis]|uniref:sensor histidine kinase n=1 Tax=Paenibacillus turpanensis TaxID=2689078 RepID=UPI00140C3455|nr:sensor histidine kinase [Paenibacillus turpanensis]
MRRRDWLLDRMLPLSIYAVSLSLVVLVVYFGYGEKGVVLSFGNVVYMLVLGAAMAALWIGIDYLKQRQWLRTLRGFERKGELSLDRLAQLEGAATREQQLFVRLLQEQHRLYAQELARYREQGERQQLFASQWVHQMKTPVSVVDLVLQQTGPDASPAQLREALDSIAEENERLTSGLDLMLYSVRLDKLEVDTRPQQVALDALLRELINEQKKQWIRASIYPRLVGSAELPVVETDEKWIAFVFRQVLSNALKYTLAAGKEKAEITIHIRNAADGIQVEITDEGIGIPEQDLGRVFHPFFTGENGRVVKESTGMGLYLAKEVCRRLGHTLLLRSEQGKGTKVTVGFTGKSIHKLSQSE